MHCYAHRLAISTKIQPDVSSSRFSSFCVTGQYTWVILKLRKGHIAVVTLEWDLISRSKLTNVNMPLSATDF